jgi:hypothetical protein
MESNSTPGRKAKSHGVEVYGKLFPPSNLAVAFEKV